MSSLFDDGITTDTANHNEPRPIQDEDDVLDDDTRPVRAAAGVGASLLRSMASGKSKRNTAPSGGAPPPNKQYVPSVIGGFAGSGTVSYERYALSEGSIVVRLPPASTTAPAAAAPSPAPPAFLTFKHEEDIGEEELEGTLNYKLVGQITRMSPSSTDVEIRLADGSREKVSVLELRAAGAVEERAFRKWQFEHQRHHATGPTTGEKRSRDDAVPPASFNSDQPWWVVKGIVVRVVNESLTTMCGRKYVVASASKKDDRVLLGDFTEASDEKGGATGKTSRGPLAGGHTVRQQDLETVIPKDGGKALVLLGEHRGEMVTVVQKIRSDVSREVQGVRATAMSSGATIVCAPDHLSQFAA